MSAVTRSLYWSIVSKLSGQGLGLLSTLVLTRFLDPGDFGLVALSMIYIGFINNFVDAGFQFAIIQKKEISQLELSSCFWFLMICGAAAVALTFASVPLITMAFDNVEVRSIVMFQSFVFLALPLRIVTSGILSRDLRIDVQAKVETFWMVVRFAASIVMAIGHLGVWSLIVPTVVSEYAVAVTFAVVCRWVPGRQVSFRAIRPLVTFGMDVTGGRIIWFLYARADQLIVNRFLGTEALGIYSIAQNITNAALQFAVSFSRIIYPVFSRLQDQLESLRNRFQQVNRLINDFYGPVFVGLLIVAPDFIHVAFTGKWNGMVLPLQILCVVSIFRINESNVGLLLNALGHSRTNLIFNLVSTIVVVPAMYLGCRYSGLTGLLVALCATYIPLTFLFTLNGSRTLGIGVFRYYANLYPSLKAVLAMTVPVLSVGLLLRGAEHLVRLVSMILVGSASYVAFVYFFNPSKWKEIFTILLPDATSAEI